MAYFITVFYSWWHWIRLPLGLILICRTPCPIGDINTAPPPTVGHNYPTTKLLSRAKSKPSKFLPRISRDLIFQIKSLFQIGHDIEEKPTRGQHYIRASQSPLYPTSHYPIVETGNGSATAAAAAPYRLPTGGGFMHHQHAIYAGHGQPV